MIQPGRGTISTAKWDIWPFKVDNKTTRKKHVTLELFRLGPERNDQHTVSGYGFTLNVVALALGVVHWLVYSHYRSHVLTDEDHWLTATPLS